MSTKSLAKKRERLWNEDPHCHYCGVETILKPCHLKREWLAMSWDERNRLATIDHIRPRHHPDRTKPPEPGETLLVLSCWRCNNDRDKQELAEKPKEWFIERGGAIPISMRSIEEVEALLPKIGEPYQKGRGRRAREKFNKFKRSQIAVLWELYERGMDA